MIEGDAKTEKEPLGVTELLGPAVCVREDESEPVVLDESVSEGEAVVLAENVIELLTVLDRVGTEERDGVTLGDEVEKSEELADDVIVFETVEVTEGDVVPVCVCVGDGELDGLGEA